MLVARDSFFAACTVEELCCERWNEFQVFNDHVVSNHKYSMTFGRKLSIKTEEITLKAKNSIKISDFICFLCTLCELYG